MRKRTWKSATKYLKLVVSGTLIASLGFGYTGNTAHDEKQQVVNIQSLPEVTVKIDGQIVNFTDQHPINQDGRTLVPMRAIFEELGAEVEWEGETKTARARKGETSIVLPIGDKIATVNAKTITLDVTAQIMNGRILVPLRFVSESLEAKVEWVAATQTVLITTEAGTGIEHGIGGTVDSTNFERISAYMEEECKQVFSPYYELLEFEISNYQEEAVNGKVEAIFSYKLVHKNYDRDPDTVGYIKEAKERGNKNYQLMYDEYLQPKEMNFQLKVIIDGNDLIILYSNVSPKGIEWEETKMSDFIISK